MHFCFVYSVMNYLDLAIPALFVNILIKFLVVDETCRVTHKVTRFKSVRFSVELLEDNGLEFQLLVFVMGRHDMGLMNINMCGKDCNFGLQIVRNILNMQVFALKN